MINKHAFINPINGHARHGISCAAEKPRAALAIIHGLGEHSGRYAPMMEHLAQNGISSFALDLEGHGQSGLKPGVCKDYEILHGDVSLALAESARLFPSVPVFLFGHSMGGGLVLNHGLQKAPDGVKGYIVSAPLIYPAEPVSTILRFVVRTLRKISPNFVINSPIDGSKVSSLPEVQKQYESDPLNHGNLGVGLASDMVRGGEWVAENAGAWTQPLLIIHSRDDKLTQFVGSEAFADSAQNCTFLPFENCEHEIHNDVTREDFYAAIIKFMETQI